MLLLDFVDKAVDKVWIECGEDVRCRG